jgi:hypothetical protein
MEYCANCETIIGNLETPFVWRDHVVCATCHRRLEAQRATGALPPMPGLSPSLAAPTVAAGFRHRTMAWPWVGVVVLVLAVAGAVLYVAGGITGGSAGRGPAALRHAGNGSR